jgi:hypothetical protein
MNNKKKINKKDYICVEKNNEVFVKNPGSIDGKDFAI